MRTERRGRKVLRCCDNREVARRWLSFYGLSDEGKNKRKHHFPHDGRGLYEKIFLSTPRFHRDVLCTENRRDEELEMRPGRPPAVWLLYSYELFELVKYLLPVATKVRARVRRELATSTKQPTLSEINTRLLQTPRTRIEFALSMLDHVVLQLSGFAMARAFGEEGWLAPATGSCLINTGLIGQFHKFAEFPDTLRPEAILDLSRRADQG